uniref:Putative evasin n=1 Tax=Hyalomma excavatum TaxID=257692 RepID=A0A131XAS6_9ACAR
MASVKTIRSALFLLMAAAIVCTCTSAIFTTPYSRGNNGDGSGIDLVYCNSTCTAGGNECPSDCICFLKNQERVGYCYKFAGLPDDYTFSG